MKKSRKGAEGQAGGGNSEVFTKMVWKNTSGGNVFQKLSQLLLKLKKTGWKGANWTV